MSIVAVAYGAIDVLKKLMDNNLFNHFQKVITKKQEVLREANPNTIVHR